jgi:hypothetical protein
MMHSQQNITNVTRWFEISIVCITTQFYEGPKLEKSTEVSVCSTEDFIYFPQVL